jgi:restriction endonuclease S subunit
MTWETVRLGEVCTFKTGKTPSTKKIEYFNGSINWYTPGDIGDSKFLTQSVRTITDLAIGENQASLLPENTLLVTCIGEIGRVGILSKPASSNQQITGLTFDERVLPKYAYYWFISNRNVLKDRSNNAVVPILNNAALKEISFKYPPLHIQEQIADTLDKADALRRKDQDLLTKYDELAQALFYDMFGDPEKNEKGWESVELSELIQIKPTTVKPENLKNQIYIGLENIEKESGLLSISKETDLKNIENELDNIIKADKNLSNLFEKITSVTGVGKVTALFLICYTNEFKLYYTPRQIACYCGVVPFEHTSGKSVRAKPRVHYMANKKLKKQLHMCAISSIRAEGELKESFERKVAEWKNKMLVINNVRNKLIHRICSCVNNNKLYEKRISA